MEFINGRKLTEILDDPPVPLAILADRMVDLYLAMAFKNFFVHADLHPGNIFVDDEGSLILLDTGLVYETPPNYLRKLFRVYAALMTMDGRLVTEAYLEGLDVSDEKREAATTEMAIFLAKYEKVDCVDIEVGKTLFEAFGLLRRHRIYFDAEFTGFFLSEITFEGIAKMLNSEIDLTTVVPARMPAFVASHDFIDPDDPVIVALVNKVERDGPAS